MSSTLSIGQALAKLQAQIALHRERTAFHAQQEEVHRERKEHHAAELERATAQFEAFRTAAESTVALLEQSAAPPDGKEQGPDLRPGKRGLLRRVVDQVLAGKSPEETFSQSSLSREIRQRYGQMLSGRVDPRNVSAILRRLAAAKKIHVAQEGRAHREALYTRQPKPVPRAGEVR